MKAETLNLAIVNLEILSELASAKPKLGERRVDIASFVAKHKMSDFGEFKAPGKDRGRQSCWLFSARLFFENETRNSRLDFTNPAFWEKFKTQILDFSKTIPIQNSVHTKFLPRISDFEANSTFKS